MVTTRRITRANLPQLPEVDVKVKSAFGYGSKSSEWKHVEKAVAVYNDMYDNPNNSDGSVAIALRAVNYDFEAWKKSKGGGEEWKKSRMNKDLLSTQIDVALHGGNYKSDKVFGENNQQLIDDMEIQRAGIMFMFAKMDTPELEVSEILLDIAFSAVTISLSAAGGAMELAGKAHDDVKEMKEHFEMLARNIELGKMGGELLEKPVVPMIRKALSVQGMKDLWDKIMRWAQGLIRKVVEHTMEAVGATAMFAGKTAIVAVKWLLRLLNTDAAKHATAFVGAFVELAGNLVSGIGKSMEYASRYFSERKLKEGGVEIRKGHPAAIVKALDVFQAFDIGQSFVDAMINAAKGGVGVASHGIPLATMLISIIAAAVKCIAGVAIKVWQSLQLNKLIKQAKVFWRTKTCFNDPIEFNKWFRPYALTIPVVSACALNFAGCSNPIFFFKMMDDPDGKPFCSESAYGAATGLLYETNKSLCKFAKNQGIELKSDDVVIKNVIKVVFETGPFNSTSTIPGGGNPGVLKVAKVLKKIGETLGG